MSQGIVYGLEPVNVKDRKYHREMLFVVKLFHAPADPIAVIKPGQRIHSHHFCPLSCHDHDEDQNDPEKQIYRDQTRDRICFDKAL